MIVFYIPNPTQYLNLITTLLSINNKLEVYSGENWTLK